MSEPSLEPAGEKRDETPLRPAPEAISIDLSLAEGLPRSAQRKHWAVSLFVAFAAHALILLAASWIPSPRTVGAGGVELEAIDIDIVSAKVLESRSSSTETAAAPPDAVDHTVDGGTPAEASADAADQAPSQSEAATKPAGPIPDLVIPDVKEEEPPPEPAEVALSIAETRSDKPDLEKPEPEPERSEQNPEPEPATPSAASEASEAAEEGGSAARGVEIEQTASGQQAAAASAGEASEYAMTVVETLARRLPRVTAGVRGTVRISFKVGSAGEVREVRVLISSGRRVLDEAVLSLVQQVRFPMPPPGLAKEPLSYEIPYTFR